MTENKTLLSTVTGEPYQPARIYYRVFNQKAVLNAFKKLRCMDFDRSGDRWVWVYEFEAKKLKFDRSYRDIPHNVRPIVLGYFTFQADDLMLLDLRSFDRVTRAIEFFDKHVSRRAAKATRFRIVNRLFSLEELPDGQIHSSLDIFFDRDDIKPPQSEEILAKIAALKAEYPDENECRKVISDYLDGLLQEPNPEIEELPVNYYEDGTIGPTVFLLKMRQREALERWQGNENYRAAEAIQQLF